MNPTTRRLRTLHRHNEACLRYLPQVRMPLGSYCLGYVLAYTAAEAGPEDEARMTALVVAARALVSPGYAR